MVAHRAWRLRQTGGGGCWSSAAIRFYETEGGADVTQGAGGTPYADSVYDNNFGSYGPAKAFDGDDGSIWHNSCPGTSGSWIGYDFGAGNPQEITYARIRKRGAYPEQSPTGVVLEWTDDDPAGAATWNGAGEVTGINWYGTDDYGDSNEKGFSFIPEEAIPDSTALDFTGDTQTYTVPAGVASVKVRMWGGGGHGGQYGGGNMGGSGGYLEFEMPVEPGDVLGFQVAEGGRNATGNGWTRGKGGWPDGGWGSRGDTWGGGGGGSSRLWLNGSIRAVVGGGGGAAGYSGNGGGGGGQGGSDGNTAPVADPGGRPGYDDGPYGWKIGRKITDVGAVGRTGGFGGWMLGGTGDDGGGGGGGYYGGGGSGGDGRAGAGGLTWTHTDCYNVTNIWGSNNGAPPKSGSPDYAGGAAQGRNSNTQAVAGNGRVVFAFDTGAAPIEGGGFGAPIYEYIFDRPADSYWSYNLQGKTTRCAFNADARTGNATTFRINLRGAGSGTRINKMFVGKRSDTGSGVEGAVSSDIPMVQVFFDGEPDVFIPTDTLISSDVIDMPLGDGERLIVSIYHDPSASSNIFIGGSGDGYDYVEGDEAGGRNGYYVMMRSAGDVAGTQVVPYGETYEFWNFVESIQAVTYTGEEPEPEVTTRRRMIVVT